MTRYLNANYNVIFRKSICRHHSLNVTIQTKGSKMRHILWKFDLEEKVRGYVIAYTAGNNVLNS